MFELNRIVLESIDSTNTYLKDMASAGSLRPGTCVMAREQLNGRGRGSRRWRSRAGQSMTASFWIDAESFFLSNDMLCALPLAAGLASALALEKHYEDTLGRRCAGLVKLKWPNDIWTEQGKMGGILCELAECCGKIGVVVGIGLNLLGSGKDEFFQDLGRRAVSWEETSGLRWDAEAAFYAVGEQLYDLAAALGQKGFESMAGDWYERCLHRGRMVTVSMNTAPSDADFQSGSLKLGEGIGSTGDGSASGTTVGIGGLGQLILRNSSGKKIEIMMGDVFMI